jgi:hypothetical protein
MKLLLLKITLILFPPVLFATEQITPYKFTDEDMKRGSLFYEIPEKSRVTIKRMDDNAPDIIYYMSKPNSESYPIAILCGGSCSKDSIFSIIHFHRYLLKEFLDLDIGVLTVEQWGVDGEKVNKVEFMKNYTRSMRLKDHEQVIEHLKACPPKKWNGKFIFLGVSEGGPIVTTLTTKYADITAATINWSGAGDFSWRDELWYFINHMINYGHWSFKFIAYLPSWMLYSLDWYIPKSQKEHSSAMDETIKNPTPDLYLAGMTYKYHADALITYPEIEYSKILTPYLVVSGTKDSFINSSDAFVMKAKEAKAPITYMRVEGMDHYVRKREDVIKSSFDWLKNNME